MPRPARPVGGEAHLVEIAPTLHAARFGFLTSPDVPSRRIAGSHAIAADVLICGNQRHGIALGHPGQEMQEES